jgi:hypothetical protein
MLLSWSWSWMNNVIRWLRLSKRAFSPSAPLRALTHSASRRAKARERGTREGQAQSSVCAYDLHAQATVEDLK